MMVVTASQIAAWTDAVRTLRWFHQVRFARLGLSRHSSHSLCPVREKGITSVVSVIDVWPGSLRRMAVATTATYLKHSSACATVGKPTRDSPSESSSDVSSSSSIRRRHAWPR